MFAHRAAFTLLEMCLSLAIGLVLILLGVPSVVGVLAEQRLHDSYARFEQLANTARARSFLEHRPYRLLWDKHGIVVEAVSRDAGKAAGGDRLDLAEGEVCQVERTAALVSPAPPEWTFWPDGTCEPVVVSYRGPSGQWRVRFDALSVHGTFLQSETL
jgi:Tfp pilus assembly protein FimT